jgi:DegV family protein with EDD domain
MQLTDRNTAIVLDSTADLGDAVAEHPNWRAVPLVVRFGDEELRDHVDIETPEFYRRLTAGGAALPTTAAPPPGAWAAAFSELADYSRILVLPISSRLSASSQSAEIAARDADPDGGRITVLDGRSASFGTALLADALQRRLAAGTAGEELLAAFGRDVGALRLFFTLDTLEYLERGGRIGRAQALVGSVLNIRPILTLVDGEVTPFRKARGRARVLRELERALVDALPEGAPAHVAVGHARSPESAAELRAAVERQRPAATVDRVVEIGPVIGVYVGPGASGLAILPDG